MRNYFLIFAFIIFCNLCYSQDQSKDLFQVVLFKSKESDVKNRKFIRIDSLGNIYSFNKPIGEKLDIKMFNKSIHRFVNLESKIEKIPASDYEPPLTIIPTTAEYTFEITVKFLKDFHAEKNRKAMTKYYWVNVSEVDNQKLFFKYLSKEDKAILTRLLN
jgi:hypothetical protein